jgi:two-component system, OmpR family, phosphate regulon sensor histidine kinase PhoR
MLKFQVSKLQIARLLMLAAIVLIAGFQVYWLHKLYSEEASGFKKTTDVVFRETMYKVQAQRLNRDSFFYKYIPEQNSFMGDVAELVTSKIPKISFSTNSNGQENEMSFSTTIDSSEEDLDIRNDNPENTTSSIVITHSKDSLHQKKIKSTNINITQLIQDGINIGLKEAGKELRRTKVELHHQPEFEGQQARRPAPFPHNMRAKDVLVKSRVLNDTISIEQIDSVYKKALALNGITAVFHITKDSIFKPENFAGTDYATSKVPVGFLSKNAYQASFDAPTFFLLGNMMPQMGLSVLLVAFIAITFLFLYRNLLAQRRLALMKNDFISNITHELKTPIATVNVAIEALRNFDALESPARTKEYLDISATELQRLSMLVDKVLKLSMFENKEIELQKEPVDLQQLVDEVIYSMRLQFEKQSANISFKTFGPDFTFTADRMHITSVIYNLFDNALKYSKSNPSIQVELASIANELQLSVSDNGIGISAEYADKIFDKFFRVPSGDHHNIKGYGLGLSYVAEVVRKHNGTIQLETELGKGSRFMIKLPKT